MPGTGTGTITVNASKVSINGIEIKRPWPFKISRYKVSSLERMADATMVGDFIARKRTFEFTYEAINSVELKKILDIIWESDTMFFTLGWIENNQSYTATVYPGAIPQTLHRTGSVWTWEDVHFQLIEQ